MNIAIIGIFVVSMVSAQQYEENVCDDEDTVVACWNGGDRPDDEDRLALALLDGNRPA